MKTDRNAGNVKVASLTGARYDGVRSPWLRGYITAVDQKNWHLLQKAQVAGARLRDPGGVGSAARASVTGWITGAPRSAGSSQVSALCSGEMERLRPELIAEIACATAEPAAFEREVLALLQADIGVDVGFFCNALGVSDVALGLDPRIRPLARRRWARLVAEMAPVSTAAEQSGGVVVDSELLGSNLERFVYYETFMRPHRGRTTLIGALRCQARQLGKLVLGRCVGSPDFNASEVSRLRELLPILSLSQHTYLLARESVTPVPAVGPARTPRSDALTGCGLTVREREVLGYLHLGYTNEQIALALGSAPRTVRNQLSHVYEKLGVSSRAEAVAVSMTFG